MMDTVKQSHARALRERYPLPTGGQRVGDWCKLGDGTAIRCGLAVFDVADPRHVGAIVSYNGSSARVRWFETGWLSDVPIHHLIAETQP